MASPAVRKLSDIIHQLTDYQEQHDDELCSGLIADALRKLNDARQAIEFEEQEAKREEAEDRRLARQENGHPQ